MVRLACKLVLLNQIVAGLDYNIVFVAEDVGDLVGDPLLHQVNVDLLNVDLLIELGWKLGRPKALLVDAERHVVCAETRLTACGVGATC